MTTSTWDKNKIGLEFGDCTTINELLVRLENRFSQTGEVICEIKINGLVLDEEGETRYAHRSAEEIQLLQVRSNQPAALICQALSSAHELVGNLERATLEGAEKFRSSEVAQAQISFGEILEGSQWLVDALMHVRSAISGLGQSLAAPDRWRVAEETIGKCTHELSQAYANKDMILVADILEYEFTNVLQAWQDVIDSEASIRMEPSIRNESFRQS